MASWANSWTQVALGLPWEALLPAGSHLLWPSLAQVLEPFQFPSLPGSPSAFYTLDPSSCLPFFTPCHKGIPYPKGSPLSQGYPLFQGFTLFKRISLIPRAHPYQKDIPYPKGSPLITLYPVSQGFSLFQGLALITRISLISNVHCYHKDFAFPKGYLQKPWAWTEKAAKNKCINNLSQFYLKRKPFYLHQNAPKVKHLNNSTYISLNFKNTTEQHKAF